MRHAAANVAAVLAASAFLMPSGCAPLHPGQRICEEAGVPYQSVIAHRGASYYAPEATRPAYLLARDLGATYLELDLQRTADGVLIAFHDDDLSRTTNVATVHPGRGKDPISSFAWAELLQLDAGSWFNEDNARANYARSSFEGLQILSLEDVIDIAEGGDSRPGIYIETKVPDRYPGIEKELADLLTRRGWYSGADELADNPASATPVGGPKEGARVILQTFERESFELLRRHLPEAPAVLLLWVGDGYLPDNSMETYAESVEFAARYGAAGIGADHENLVEPWAVDLVHETDMFIHGYTVDDSEVLKVLSERGVDGFITNRPDICLEHYGRKPSDTVEEILGRLGYAQ